MFQPQGRRSFQVRPWLRNSGQNALNWNQRTYSSPVSSGVVMKPPVSVPHNGMPVRPQLRPTGTCIASVRQAESMSPDQSQP